ncbi:hypothetical protein B0H10DRAFT_2056629 [Mycena sp. CBHHK59/15]|nr:hypothetical protein B0H10DRAFT_2056629 [Mycena sp. CBHHK59/15]
MLARSGAAVVLSRANGRVYSTATQGPNHAILEMLKQNKEEEAQSPDKNVYKIRAFTSAIKVIKQLDSPIRSAAEAKALKGVGEGICRRIQDFLETSGHSPDASDPDALKRQRIARAVLEEVPGIGPVKARELVKAGCMTLAQLRTPQYLDMLTTTQRVGAKYFEHLETRVTRVEAETVTQSIRDSLSSKYEVIIGGSYRRGAPTSSDIDLIILHPDHVHVPVPKVPPSAEISTTAVPRQRYSPTQSSILQLEVVPALQARGILAATLWNGALKWQGIVLIPGSESYAKDEDQFTERRRRAAAIENGEGAYRRMDLNLVAQKSRSAALLALTGDTEFNRDLRIRASKLGMHLNEFGLWRWNEYSDGKEDRSTIGYWELVRAETEEEVLQELGMDYVEPTKRNFSLVLGKVDVLSASRRKKRAL